MSTQAIAAAVAAKTAAVTGMRGASANTINALPASPWAVVGNHRGTFEAGAFEEMTYTFTMHTFVERTGDDDQTQATVNDLLDAIIAAFRSGITLGTTVAQTRITAWNTDLYQETATAKYQVLETTLEILVKSGRTYTA